MNDNETTTTTTRREQKEIDDNFKKRLLDVNHECYICLDKLLKGSCVRELSCGHCFCIDCIDTWLSDRQHIHCPVCKYVLF